jgi:hypothetical protein
MASSNPAAASHYPICFYATLLICAALNAVATIGIAIRHASTLSAVQADGAALRIWCTTLAARAASPIRRARKASFRVDTAFFLTQVDTLTTATILLLRTGSDTLAIFAFLTFTPTSGDTSVIAADLAFTAALLTTG